MNKEYEAPQLNVQHFHVMDTVTSDGDIDYSINIPDDPQWDWEEW